MVTATIDRESLLTLYTNPDTCPTDSLTPVSLSKEPAFISWQQDIPAAYLDAAPDELDLRLMYPEDRTKVDFTIMLTVQTMNYLHSGRHRVAL